MTLLSFVSDESLFECLDNLYEKFNQISLNFDLKKFYDNKVDPFKFYFDMNFKGIEIKEYLEMEVQRKRDKSISNAIGDFHEELLGKLPGLKRVGSAGSHDIESRDKKIFAEIKNKHNTVKGEDKPTIFNKLKELVDQNPDSIGYYVRIIDTKSQNEVWEFTSKKVKYTDPRVKI
ncbi:Eco47II family restriction endonuclease, partial [Kurthia massiliensis]|uniref:Eco47II family restriction endonuclease n=1 Tax=Kurthia massiliensis TaxID=1033739 RepID=UPI00028862F8